MVELLVLSVWVTVGMLIIRRSRVAGLSVLWMVVLGPLGLLAVGFGEWRRRKVGLEPPVPMAPENLEIPVQVDVDGQWLDGLLHTWSVTDRGWHGWVSFGLEGSFRTGWFAADHVRRQSTPDPEASAETR